MPEREESKSVNPADLQEALKNCEKSLEAAEAESKQNWDALLRARAELENLRKRTVKEVENAHRFGLEGFLRELLPVKDSLELGIAALEDQLDDMEKVREGQQLTLNMLNDVLGRFGVEEIDPMGEMFDPERHEAMRVEANTEAPDNHVIRVHQKGYLLNDRLLRPARVVVSKNS